VVAIDAWPIARERVSMRPPRCSHRVANVCRVVCGLRTAAVMDAAREELRTKIRVTRDEGVPFAVIARAAGLSRERVRQLYAGR
jgi:hypothetical protein